MVNIDPEIRKYIKKEAKKFIQQSWDKAYPLFTGDKLNQRNKRGK